MMGRDELQISEELYANQVEEVMTAMLAGLIAVADARDQTVEWCREQARDRLREVDRIATTEAVRRTLFFSTEFACLLARMNSKKSG